MEIFLLSFSSFLILTNGALVNCEENVNNTTKVKQLSRNLRRSNQ